MPRQPTKTRERTRQRLLQAAIAVFSNKGVVGATTREIARLAEVNEVTLFRHFQTKEHLLAAVADHVTLPKVTALQTQPEWTYDLRHDLYQYAKLYDTLLEEQEALVRMFIGEGRRHPTESEQVLQHSFLPLRDTLIAYLQTCIDRGMIAADIELPLAVDQFTGMLLAGMLRRHVIHVDRGYDRDRYVQSCTDLFIRALTVPLPHPTEAV